VSYFELIHLDCIRGLFRGKFEFLKWCQ